MYIKKILLLIVAITLIVGSIFSYTIYNKIFDSNTNFDEVTKEVLIPTGTTFNDVVTKLTPYLRDVKSFEWLAKKKGYATRVKPGKYVLIKGSNNNELITNLRSRNIPVKVSFNNQERLENLAGRVAEQIELDSLALLQVFKDEKFLKEHGFNLNTAISMYVPNSYQVFWNISAEAFRDKMWKEYGYFWNDKRKGKAEAIGLKPKEVVALASIVHKETVKIKERPRVAGVYMNRLKLGMKLDADPTVIYALKKSENKWDRVIKRVLRKDLKLEHPYNTYKYKGLPPGPIAMPDISAVDAVLNYEKHDYFYFVADVENFGFHKFSKSLRQHNNYSSKYHKWVNSKGIKR
ncbi:endolytic transglycosylase MltG [Aquimarina agarilytica]|uniref:endolytic transglycosylase MltG n=1 Tax=Aquimarina agarilytica TaxID=1087449 RepID=UPI0002898EA7|nr:endolytic transglycosylase MltG [Aquimarina agarilytica]